jgi:hypothetical protein
VTKIALTEHKGSETAEFSAEKFGFHTDVSPIYEVTDEDAEIIAKFEDGATAAAIKDGIAYIAVGDVPPALWNELAKRSGAHIYTEERVPIYGDSRFISCQFPEERTDFIRVREDGVYVDMLTGEEFTAKDGILSFEHYAYRMMLFAKKEDVL